MNEGFLDLYLTLPDLFEATEKVPQEWIFIKIFIVFTFNFYQINLSSRVKTMHGIITSNHSFFQRLSRLV